MSYHTNHVISYIVYSVDLKRQNRLKSGTDKPKLKVEMQLVSDDYVRRRLLAKPRFELAAKGVFRLQRCYIFRQGVPGLWPATRKARLPTVDRLTGACRTKRPSAGKTAYWHERSKVRRCTSVKNSKC